MLRLICFLSLWGSLIAGHGSALQVVQWYGGHVGRIHLLNAFHGLGNLTCYRGDERIVLLTETEFVGPESWSLYAGRVDVESDGRVLSNSKGSHKRIDVRVRDVDSREHGQIFTCNWTGNDGVTGSRTIMPNVNGEIHYFKVPNHGETAKMECRGPKGYVSMEFFYAVETQYHRLNIPIEKTTAFKDRIIISEEIEEKTVLKELSILHVTTRDEGFYACVVKYKDQYNGEILEKVTFSRLYVKAERDHGYIPDYDKDPLIYTYATPMGTDVNLRGMKRKQKLSLVNPTCYVNGQTSTHALSKPHADVSGTFTRRIIINLYNVTLADAATYYCLWGGTNPRLDIFILRVE